MREVRVHAAGKPGRPGLSRGCMANRGVLQRQVCEAAGRAVEPLQANAPDGLPCWGSANLQDVNWIHTLNAPHARSCRTLPLSLHAHNHATKPKCARAHPQHGTLRLDDAISHKPAVEVYPAGARRARSGCSSTARHRQGIYIMAWHGARRLHHQLARTRPCGAPQPSAVLTRRPARARLCSSGKPR